MVSTRQLTSSDGTLYQLFAVKQYLLSSCHPQSDGLSEHASYPLEAMFRCFVRPE